MRVFPARLRERIRILKDKPVGNLQTLNEEVPSYIGRKKCGCVVAAIVDDGSNLKAVSKTVAKFIASGLAIERTTVGYVRANLNTCRHKENP